MSARDLLIGAFLESHGWGDAARHPLPGDASFRRYVRLDGLKGRAMLMDAPPPKEDVGPFLFVAAHLARLGYSAPRILAEDHAGGLLLLEDLGDDTFTRLLAGGGDEAALYRLAFDLLVDLHGRGAAAIPAGLPLYDESRLLDEAALLVEWYYPAVTGHPLAPAAAAAYRALWRPLLDLARAVPQTLVLRDFHVDNLMRLERPGLAACGLLDFQDAVAGPVTYDLVSLLEDARRDVDPALAERLKADYLKAFPALGAEAFAASFAVMAAQRHAKVIGIFTRLYRRDGKAVYLAHIPRVWRLLERALSHPALAGLAAWLDEALPPARRVVP